MESPLHCTWWLYRFQREPQVSDPYVYDESSRWTWPTSPQLTHHRPNQITTHWELLQEKLQVSKHLIMTVLNLLTECQYNVIGSKVLLIVKTSFVNWSPTWFVCKLMVIEGTHLPPRTLLIVWALQLSWCQEIFGHLLIVFQVFLLCKVQCISW